MGFRKTRAIGANLTKALLTLKDRKKGLEFFVLLGAFCFWLRELCLSESEWKMDGGFVCLFGGAFVVVVPFTRLKM